MYAVSRSADKLKKLEADLQKVGTKGGKLVQVVGDFKTPEEAQAVVKQIATDFHHVVSVLGFVDTIPKLASETTPEEFVKNWEGEFLMVMTYLVDLDLLLIRIILLDRARCQCLCSVAQEQAGELHSRFRRIRSRSVHPAKLVD